MFQFSRCPSRALCIQARMTRHDPRRVSPFGYLRINTSVQLPGAFRRFRVLRRQLVPRHSSHTLKSLHFAALECSMHDSFLNRRKAIPPVQCSFVTQSNGHPRENPDDRREPNHESSIFFALRALCNFQRARHGPPNTRSSGKKKLYPPDSAMSRPPQGILAETGAGASPEPNWRNM